MELSFLQEFVVLAEIQKFSAAAQKLHISQSTLSRHIQALETELGCALFERTTREMALSACGILYLPFAKRIVQTADDATARLKEYLRQQSQTVCIGVVHDPDLYQVIDYLMDFQKKEPLFPLNVIEGRISDLTKEFMDGRLKLMTTAYAKWEQLPKRFIPVGEGHLCALLPTAHPLASASTLDISCLNGENLILPEKNNILYRYITYILKNLNVQPNVIYQGSSSGASLSLRSGTGIMIQDEAAATRHLGNGIVQRELNPKISYTFGLAYGEELSKCEKAFVRFTKQRYQECASKGTVSK